MRIPIVEDQRFVAKLDFRRPPARSWPRGGLLAASALLVLAATPAAANPLGDCFERIAVAFHPHLHPHPAVARTAVRRVHHIHPRVHPRPHRIAASGPSRAYAHRTRYVLRPVACATHPVSALMSPVPGAVAPETPRELLADLAGPPVAVAAPATAVDTAALAPVPVETVPETSLAEQPFPGFPGVFGGPGGVFVPGIPGVPGGFPGTPPGVEVVPEVGLPPVVILILPIAPPVAGQPPTVIPPTVTGFPGVDTPPTPVIPVIPGPGVPGGVPEPASWALLLVGFFGLGGALRRRNHARRA